MKRGRGRVMFELGIGNVGTEVVEIGGLRWL